MIRRILTVLIASTLTFASGKELQPYQQVILLGAEKSYSNSPENNVSPTFLYYFFLDDLPHDMYGEFNASTTNASAIFALKNENIFTGGEASFNYSVYSAYQSYREGINDGRRNVSGSNAEGKLFTRYTGIRFISAEGSIHSSYHWYSRIKESDAPLWKSRETRIDLPSKHWEISARGEIEISNVEESDLDRIKDGAVLKIQAIQSRRIGYGTFYDIPEAESSSIKNTTKCFAAAGFYKLFSHNVNLLFDFTGGWHRGVDRNNSDQIGSFVSETAAMPGYYWGEFYQSRFAIGRVQLGLPLGFWGSRIAPSFNLLYMPKDNRVTGVDDYERKIYRSVSAELSTKVGNILPLFINYAYGIDASRYSSKRETHRRGNHEILFYIVAAFGERT